MSTRAKAVLDASAVLRAGIDRTASAAEWMELLSDGQLRALWPESIYSEIASAFVRQVRAGRLSFEAARAAVIETTRFPVETRSNRSLCVPAMTVAVSTGLSTYDAHYLALAEAEDAVLVTADRTLAGAATRSVLLE